MTRLADPWLRERLEELAADLGRLRYATRETTFAYRVGTVCDGVWWLLASETPTAADHVRNGHPIDEALRLADRETARLDRLLREKR